MSYLSTLIRYEELYGVNRNQARATPKEHHDFIVNHLVDNTRQLEKLAIFERIQIYQRDRSCVYDSEQDKTSAADILQDLLFGEWSQIEKEMLKSGEERLKDLTNRMVVRSRILKYSLFRIKKVFKIRKNALVLGVET